MHRRQIQQTLATTSACEQRPSRGVLFFGNFALSVALIAYIYAIDRYLYWSLIICFFPYNKTIPRRLTFNVNSNISAGNKGFCSLPFPLTDNTRYSNEAVKLLRGSEMSDTMKYVQIALNPIDGTMNIIRVVPLIICPLDSSHKIESSKIQCHLERCLIGDLVEMQCPWNPLHKVDECSYQDHVDICEDKPFTPELREQTSND